MPFLVTEPQRILGTTLGYCIYPYHQSFDDHIDSRKGNQKLIIVALKNSEFMEIDHVVHEEFYRYENVGTNYVDDRLKDFVAKHGEYVFDKRSVSDFFSRVPMRKTDGGKA